MEQGHAPALPVAWAQALLLLYVTCPAAVPLTMCGADPAMPSPAISAETAFFAWV